MTRFHKSSASDGINVATLGAAMTLERHPQREVHKNIKRCSDVITEFE